jgi:hypothetical protein
LKSGRTSDRQFVPGHLEGCAQEYRINGYVAALTERRGATVLYAAGAAHGHFEEAEPLSLLLFPACLASAQLLGPGVKEEARDRLEGGMTRPDRRSSLDLAALCRVFGRHEQVHPGFGQCCAEFWGGRLVR